MASTMASAKSCPRAMAAKGLRLATPENSALSFSARWILANFVAEPNLAGSRKGNGPRKDPRPLHHAPLHYAASFSFTLGTWASGLADGGRRGNRANATKRRTRPRGLSSGCRVLTYRSIASTRERASTRASVHAGWITRKLARRRMGRSGVSG